MNSVSRFSSLHVSTISVVETFSISINSVISVTSYGSMVVVVMRLCLVVLFLGAW